MQLKEYKKISSNLSFDNKCTLLMDEIEKHAFNAYMSGKVKSKKEAKYWIHKVEDQTDIISWLISEIAKEKKSVLR